jgi:hypothetical protein
VETASERAVGLTTSNSAVYSKTPGGTFTCTGATVRPGVVDLPSGSLGGVGVAAEATWAVSATPPTTAAASRRLALTPRL